ncbi:PTS sugar transporter subunit IIC [Vagococcus sp. PNs007]|uniref:Permease IIC component n=1 Tax=Vagococcus proximus TaxID=2991417 RepID=A0ABT5WYU6_9ENTE|nr:PTS sugar transporter subunit IIC [Vagococcus proximus]MDF0478933.1 PTS sugar transporter subunit IIC [Vagococcus proximus]
MNKILGFVEEKLLPPMASLSEQKHFRAIRDGIISAMPLIMIGSFFVLMVNFPIPMWTEFIAPYVPKLMLPYRVTVGMMSVYAAYGMGGSLAKSYGMDRTSGGVLSLGAFMMTIIPFAAFSENGDALGMVLPMQYLGGSGMFTAILCMIFAVEVLRLFKQKNFTIKLPEQVPDSVARSFEAILPGLFTMTIVWLICGLGGFNINEAIMKLFSPIVSIAGNSYLGVIIPVFLITLLWAAGIHGDSVIASLIRPLWLVLLDENMAAVADGRLAPNVGVEGFFDVYIWIGGSGGTLALCILFMMSKSSYMKEIGKLSVVPGIFNINEPIIFGAPIVLNPILAIPFILGPLVATTVTYFTLNAGWVLNTSVISPFAVPAPIKAFLTTGGDWKGIILVFVNIAIYFAIYYPFVKSYEKKMLAEEAENAELA